MRGSNETSSPLLHRFETSRAVERRWAPLLDNAVRESYPLSHIERVSLNDEFRGIDRFVVDDTGTRVAIEYKFDERWRQTGNAFFEITSNSTSGRLGWMATCQATWLLYFLTPSCVLVYLMERLRVAGRNWMDSYPVRPSHNDGYDTLGLCVPVDIAADAAESVSHLNRGDGIVLQPSDRF